MHIAKLLRFVWLAVVATSLAACQPGSASGDQTAAAQASKASPSSGVVTPADPYWTGPFDAISSTAMAIGGNLQMHAAGDDQSAEFAFELAGRYSTTRHSKALGLAAYAADESATWNELLNVPMDGALEIRKVTSEAIAANAPNGGLCANQPTRWIAVARRPESEGGDSLMIAAFSNEMEPGPDSDPAALCGTYFYAPH